MRFRVFDELLHADNEGFPGALESQAGLQTQPCVLDSLDSVSDAVPLNGCPVVRFLQPSFQALQLVQLDEEFRLVGRGGRGGRVIIQFGPSFVPRVSFSFLHTENRGRKDQRRSWRKFGSGWLQGARTRTAF